MIAQYRPSSESRGGLDHFPGVCFRFPVKIILHLLCFSKAPVPPIAPLLPSSRNQPPPNPNPNPPTTPPFPQPNPPPPPPKFAIYGLELLHVRAELRGLQPEPAKLSPAEAALRILLGRQTEIRMHENTCTLPLVNGFQLYFGVEQAMIQMVAKGISVEEPC